MPDTVPRYAKRPRPLFLRQIGMLLDMVTQGLPIQRPPLLRPGLAVGQRVRRFHPVINASPGNLKTTGRFRLASTALYKRHYAPAYSFAASHTVWHQQIYVQVIMGLAIIAVASPAFNPNPRRRGIGLRPYLMRLAASSYVTCCTRARTPLATQPASGPYR